MPVVSSLREFRTRPAVQAITANLGWLVLDKGIRFALGLAVGTWTARYLGPANYGTLNYALALAGLIAILPGLGLEGLVRRRFVQSPAETPALLGTVFRLRVAVGLVLYLGLIAIELVFNPDAQLQKVILFSGLLILQPALIAPDLLFQAQMRSKYSVIAQNAGLVLSSLGRVILILRHATLPAFAALIAIDIGVAAALQMRSCAKSGYPWRSWRWDGALARELLAQSWPLLVSGVAMMIYLKIDQVMIKWIAGAEAAGYSAAAVKITELCYLGPTMLASSLFPAIVRAKTAGATHYTRRIRQYFNLSAGLAYLVVLPLALAAPLIVRLLYGAAYAPSGPVLAVHLWSLVFVAQGVARQEYLLSEGLLRFSLVTTIGGALLNVVLNLWLIPPYGALGAAIATVLSLAATNVFATLLWRRTRDAGWWQIRALIGWWWLPGRPAS